MSISRVNVLILITYIFVLASLGWVLGRSSGPFLLALFCFALAVPTFLFGTYLATLRKMLELRERSEGSILRKWLGRPWMRLVFGLFTAAFAAVILLVRMSMLTWTDTALVALGVIVLAGCLVLMEDWYRKEYEPPYQNARKLLHCSLIAAALMSLIDLVVRLLLGYDGLYDTLPEAIMTARERGNWVGDSAIADAIIGWGGAWAGLEHYLVGLLDEKPRVGTLLGVLVSGVSRFPLYFAANFTACALLLPVYEYKRVFVPIRADGEIEVISSPKIAWISASMTIFVLFIYFPIVSVIEGMIEKRPSLQHPEATIIRSLESIGFEYHPRGTKEELDQLATSIMSGQDDVMASIEASLEDGFDRMRENVEVYLDWYYSLPGEWSRVATMLAGNIEGHLESKLNDFLGEGDPFKVFEQEFELAIAVQSQQQAEFRRRAEEILAARRVEVGDDEEIEVVLRAEREDVLSLYSYAGVTTLNQRLGASAATSGVSGVVAALAMRQVMMRVAARGTLRAAATAIGRLATIRAASGGGGASVGALAGGAIGSVVPGVGTAVGAVVGGIIGGVSAGVGAEFLILKMEEILARESHREELLAAIKDAEVAMRLTLGL